MDVWRRMIYDAEERGEITSEEADRQIEELEIVQQQEEIEHGLPEIENPLKEYGWWSDDI